MLLSSNIPKGATSDFIPCPQKKPSSFEPGSHTARKPLSLCRAAA